MKYLLFLISMWSTVLKAQDLPAESSNQLEEIAFAEEALEDQGLLQQLAYFIKHPLSLNEAGREDLRGLQLLTDLQVEQLLQYRNLLGQLVSVYELQAIPSFDLLTIRKILPYVRVELHEPIKESLAKKLKDGEHRLSFRLARVVGNKGSNISYKGDPNHVVLQHRYQYKNILQYGITGEKDAGEQFFRGKQKEGFDFYSFFLFGRNMGKIRALAIGDYSVNLGQGLTHWQSMAFGRSAEVMQIKRQAPVLQPYRSTGQFHFNRGAGLTIQLRKLEVTGFLSHRKISVQKSEDGPGIFTGFHTSGLFRTETEAAKKNNATMSFAGLNLKIPLRAGSVGLSAVGHRFSDTLQKQDEPYNKYAVRGRSWHNASIDYSYTWRNLHFFGEAALDRNNHYAVISGLLMAADPKIDVSILYRNIQPAYQSLFGKAFTENTSPSNENGCYVGLIIRPITGWQLNAYSDMFHFSHLSYRADGPSRGSDHLIQASYRPSRRFELAIRYRNMKKQINGDKMVLYRQPVSARQNLRLHFSNDLSRKIQVRGRMEYCWFRQEDHMETGFLGFLDCRLEATTRLSLNFRVQYFEIPSYNSRIYAFETDLPFGVSFPSFSGKGSRYLINAGYDLSKKMSWWIRWSHSFIHVPDREESVGLDRKPAGISFSARYCF